MFLRRAATTEHRNEVPFGITKDLESPDIIESVMDRIGKLRTPLSLFDTVSLWRSIKVLDLVLRMRGQG